MIGTRELCSGESLVIARCFGEDQWADGGVRRPGAGGRPRGAGSDARIAALARGEPARPGPSVGAPPARIPLSFAPSFGPGLPSWLKRRLRLGNSRFRPRPLTIRTTTRMCRLRRFECRRPVAVRPAIPVPDRTLDQRPALRAHSDGVLDIPSTQARISPSPRAGATVRRAAVQPVHRVAASAHASAP